MDGGRVPALRREVSLSTGPDYSAELKFSVANTLVVRDIKQSIGTRVGSADVRLDT
jgi:hypothetical protein